VLDRKPSRISHQHDRHHTGLHRVGDDQVGGVRNRARHVGADDDDPRLTDLAHRVGDVAAHQRARKHQHPRAMQPGNRSHCVCQLLLANQRDRVDRDALAADVVAVGLGHRALRHHADLGAAADDDHPLAVDALKGGHHTHALHALDPLQVLDQLSLVVGPRDLDLELSHIVFSCPSRDVFDIGAVLEDHLREPVQHARLVERGNEQAGDAGVWHWQDDTCRPRTMTRRAIWPPNP